VSFPHCFTVNTGVVDVAVQLYRTEFGRYVVQISSGLPAVMAEVSLFLLCVAR